MSELAQLLHVEGLRKYYPVGGGLLLGGPAWVRAVDDVSFAVRKGETLGLVGETGSGKSTVAHCLMRLEEPTGGRAVFDGQDVFQARGSALRQLRRSLQIVFQDPYGSLSPRMTVADILMEPLAIHESAFPRAKRHDKVAAMLERVGLPRSALGRYPHEFSGGQRQRIGIARALILEPKMIILDEPLSALDVSVQAQIANLLQSLKQDLGVSYLLISHDLAVVRSLADRVAVMYLGRIVETAPTAELYDRPRHPYTAALLSAAPTIELGRDFIDQRIRLSGDPPSPTELPTGCRFRTRCWRADRRCEQDDPALTAHERPDHEAACHHPMAEDLRSWSIHR